LLTSLPFHLQALVINPLWRKIVDDGRMREEMAEATSLLDV
jgi:hypothetical protein